MMLIIYEVTLKVNQDCATEFKSWLTGHIRDMLNFPGFNKANLYQNEEQQVIEYIELVVMYSIDTIESLNHYFVNHAAAMREEGLNRFPNQFTATRRILRKLLL